MARTREFDEKLALNRAIELFWRNGYASTSMREMVAYTGVAHAGLYTAFGGKEALFIAALEKYESRLFANLFAGIESTRGDLKDIQKLFTFLAASVKDPYFSYGCFLVNAASEFLHTRKHQKFSMPQNSKAINKILSRSFERKKSAFARALAKASEKKQIANGQDIDALAGQCLSFYYGITHLVRSGMSDESVQQSVEAFLGQFRR